jgi:hypothetical protein
MQKGNALSLLPAIIAVSVRPEDSLKMATRTTSATITFRHAFTLQNVEGEQRPGSYRVETDEASIEGLSHSGWRRVSTQLHLPSIEQSPLSRQVVTIDPADLQAALMKDAGQTVTAPLDRIRERQAAEALEERSDPRPGESGAQRNDRIAADAAARTTDAAESALADADRFLDRKPSSRRRS